MKILVVGGAGYVGSVTVERLLAHNHSVIVLDNLCRGHAEAVNSKAKFIDGDMGDQAVLSSIFEAEKIDAVMHFGALSLVGQSVEQPAVYFKNNVSNGIVLLDTMLAHGVKKFVFSSTAAVYGEPHTYPITEDFPLVPTSPYGDSKLAFEKILKWYANAYGMMYTALRYFNVAGATETAGEEHDPETHLIPLVLQVARGDRPHVTIFGDDYSTPDGTGVRDYIHVVDLANAHLLAIEALKTPGQANVYNLGSGTGFSVKQIIDVALKVTGKPIPTKIGPRRAGDPSVLVASSKLIQDELGWQPEFGALEKIIGDAWNWHRKNPKGYKREQANV
ncbi:MAG TPA: UDP-glucose 4-epimerase GalE [Drouetiella sp.]